MLFFVQTCLPVGARLLSNLTACAVFYTGVLTKSHSASRKRMEEQVILTRAVNSKRS